MDLKEVYFWTNTIHNWKRLLIRDKYKEIILESWAELVYRKQIAVYAFVIMPNHLHAVWEMLEPNGRELPYASFNKFTSHQFKKDLKLHHHQVLSSFQVDEKERRYRFWQNEPLAIPLLHRKIAEQKIRYIHNNPLQPHWNLAEYPEEYRWSSARYYETGIDDWSFLTHYRDRF